MRKIFMLFTVCGVLFSLRAKAYVQVQADYEGCHNGQGFISVYIYVGNQFKYFNPSCNMYWNDSFQAPDGDQCRVSSWMCSGNQFTTTINVQCQMAGFGSATIDCEQDNHDPETQSVDDPADSI